MTKDSNDLQLDFLRPDDNPEEIDDSHISQPAPHNKKWIKGVVFIITLAIFLTSLALYVRVSATPLGAALNEFSWLQGVKHLLLNEDKNPDINQRKQINLLLLGMGGQGHDGAYLTDTIIVVSFKPDTKQVALVSIPRDLYVNMGSLGWRKINSANAYGEINNYPGGGLALASQMVSEVIGQPIDYYLRVDFNGFKKLIDDLGGVDVEVEQAFTDWQYPDYNHGYQTISFTEGQHHFDGEQALQFARSRHGNNGQGSDFSRSQRQMKILMAVKDKVISAGTLLNPGKLTSLYENVTENIATNIKTFEALRFAQLGRNIERENIIHKVLDNGPDGFLRSYISDTGAYVLTTRAKDFSEIHDLFANIFAENKISKVALEQPKILILNGTNITGLAQQTSDQLSDRQFEISGIGNAPTRDWSQTNLYHISQQEKPAATELLQQTLNTNIQTSLPFEVEEKINNEFSTGLDEPIDFVIILGADQANR